MHFRIIKYELSPNFLSIKEKWKKYWFLISVYVLFINYSK